MKILGQYILLRLRQFIRQPSYVVSTMLFPSLFFLFFALPNADKPFKANLLLISFSAFAVVGVCFYQFAIEVAQEKESGWAEYLQTLPAHWSLEWAARVISTVVFAVMGAWIVYLTVRLSSVSDFSIGAMLELSAYLVAGAIPFCLLGFVLGLLCPSHSVLPVSNLFYLPLSFAGGLWIPPNALDESVDAVSVYLPTRHYAEILWAVGFNRAIEWEWLWGLSAYGVALMLFAVLLQLRFRT